MRVGVDKRYTDSEGKAPTSELLTNWYMFVHFGVTSHVVICCAE